MSRKRWFAVTRSAPLPSVRQVPARARRSPLAPATNAIGVTAVCASVHETTGGAAGPPLAHFSADETGASRVDAASADGHYTFEVRVTVDG